MSDPIPNIPNKKKGTSYIGAILFFTPFVLIGLRTFGLVCYQLFKVNQATSWKAVNANVRSAELIVSDGTDATSYKVEAEYDYTIDGKYFKGNSVSFNSGMNNIEDYGGLAAALDEAKVIQIYVNEDNPDESVDIRGITNSIVIMGLFSIMWNALLLTFILPVLYENVSRGKLMIITVVIWILAFSKIIFQLGDIDISKQVVVIEAKEEE